MDSKKTSGSGAKNFESQSLLSTHTDIASVCTFAKNSVKEMEELTEEFDAMGNLGLFWDSKIPEDDKSIFNWFSFKCSNKKEVKEEIKKYLDFYEDMHTAMEKIRGNKEKSATETEDPCSIILDLQDLLIDTYKVAQSDVNSTDSTALYNLHKEFIVNRTKIENMVKRVECVLLRDKIKNLTSVLDNCQNTLTAFQNGMHDFHQLKIGMEEQIEQLVEENEKQRQHQQALIAMNKRLREDQFHLLHQYGNTYKQMESIEQLLKELTAKK